MEFDLHSDQRLNVAKEMYLKAILQLSEEGIVKQSDLVKALSVSKSSVNEMVSKLRQEGFLADAQHIELSIEGKEKAQIILNKYQILKDFLEQTLGMANGDPDACRLEHACSDEMILKLESFMKKQ